MSGPAHATGRGKCHNRPMRFFNTEGPVRPDDHYAVPSLDCLFRSKVINDSCGRVVTFAGCTALVQGV